jgi:hypothetical protein
MKVTCTQILGRDCVAVRAMRPQFGAQKWTVHFAPFKGAIRYGFQHVPLGGYQMASAIPKKVTKAACQSWREVYQ